MTSIIPSEHQEMMHLQKGAWCQNKHINNANRFIQRETRASRKRPLQDKTEQQHSTTTTLPRTDRKEDYMIKDAWTNLVQAEDYLVRGITAFLLRINQEEKNPTFEHPDNWNQLNLQEKANLIIIDNIIKLVDLQDCKNTT